MTSHFQDLHGLLTRTQDAVTEFKDMLTPKIESAEDEHERLYWHHIYEEEEQRTDRLHELLPKLNYYIENDNSRDKHNLEFIYLLQDISLEKFGLHNFEEHLDLALYWFKEAEDVELLERLREVTSNDYALIKTLLQQLNEQFDGAASKAGSIPTDEKTDTDASLKALKYTAERPEDSSDSAVAEHENIPLKNTTKRFTVGSLKNEN